MVILSQPLISFMMCTPIYLLTVIGLTIAFPSYSASNLQSETLELKTT